MPLSPPLSERDRPPTLQERARYIEVQQVRLLYTHASTGLAATILNAGIATVVLWQIIAPLSLLSWVAFIVMLTLARFVLVRAYHRIAPQADQIRQWRLLFILGAGCAGTAWGSAGIFLFPHESIAHQIFLIFILGGMGAGAIATLSSDKFAFLAFFLPTLLPITVRLLLYPTYETSMAMGLLLVAFAAVLLITALQLHAWIVESLQLRLANFDLVQNLSVAKDRAENSNSQLAESNRALSTAMLETKASEERFRSLSAASPIGIFQTDVEGRCIYVNERWQQIVGLTLAEAEGDGWSRAIHPEDRVVVFAEWTRTASESREFSREFRVLTPQGETRWAHLRSQAILSDNGQLIGHVGTVEDVTERKRTEEVLRESQERYRSIIETAQDAFIVIDTNGVITDWNRQAEITFGWTRTEIIGQSLAETLIPPRYREAHRGGLQHFLTTGDGPVLNKRIELTALHHDEREFPVELTIWPAQRGPTHVFNAFVRDISERRAVERMKDEFVSVVSHELRTPLTSIRGALGLLTSGLISTLPERGQRMLEIAVNNTDRLVRLINDILDIERMQAGKVTMQRQLCNAATLLTQASEEMQGMADKAGVTLVVTPRPLRLWADPDRLVQTLTNLLSNAIKFSPPHTTVWVTTERRGEDAVFTVRDQGRGIPADKLESIFERFQQVDASDSRQKGGTGLGLAICRSIVQQHGGRIWVESGAGAGSTFYFTLPVWKEGEPPLAGPVGRPLVLVCDDDPAVLEVVQAVLEQRGYQVVTVTTGHEAVVQAEAQQPAAILLDLLMPQMNGWETMAALKRKPETRHIPIIIFSGLQPKESASLPVSVADWLQKPLDEGALFLVLKRALSGQVKVGQVLVVEDDLDLAGVLIARFQRHGIETMHARTGREAIEVCEQVRPDLLVLDLILPDGDGFAVVDWLRQQDQLRQVPLVVYSAKDLDAGEREQLQLGHTEFFTKGRITPQEFEHRVIGLLARLVPNEGGNLHGHD